MPPLVLTTWSFGPVANEPASAILRAGGAAIDACEAGAIAVENDPSINSVGVGGLPDADGHVSLDGCIMTDPDQCGSVAFIRRFANPVSIARRVMEKTIHVMLVGEGAEQFALREGFTPRDLSTPYARAEWDKWRADPRTLERARYRGWIPPLNVEERARSHDTVSILALDKRHRLAGVCSTSGMAFKVPGRVGDSPIIGHGLYVDQEAGAAAATGNGELVMGTCTSFLAVELMRSGATPLQAAEQSLQRIIDRFELLPDHQVAIIVLAPVKPDGSWAGWASAAIKPGFHHTITDDRGTRIEPPTHVLAP
ncbi:MAG: N(4)-(beta-N-acetylglucosaminyl)-L-asparaginase [Phycisphaerales bacterium]|nr:N(4)-(beta-N-acetylglucosaminyl)-L-asparaginase [Phycisphaerales bacterium]